jgi:2-methylisocitrate lyase-like PEP mutase family enzyme
VREQAGRLRALLGSGKTLEIPGAHDALTARCVELIGFDAVYAGGSYTASMEHVLPDIGMVTTTELLEHSRRLVEAVRIPVIADIDDGGGNPFRVRRAVHDALRIGLAGVQLEDLDSSRGKHLGPGNHGDTMLPLDIAVQNIEAAAEARGDSGLVIVARTETAVLGSRDDIIDRARRYAQAGADLIMVAHLTPEGYADTKTAVGHPMAQLALSVTPEERKRYLESGVEMLIYPRIATMPAFIAAWDALVAFKRTGELGSSGADSHREHYRRALDTDEWNELGARYGL